MEHVREHRSLLADAESDWWYELPAGCRPG